MRNSGKPSEADFEAELTKRFGKDYYLLRLRDMSDTRARVSFTQPADFVLTLPFEGMAYAEVKSTYDDSLHKSMFRPAQLQGMKRQLAAGGEYWIFIQHLPDKLWYICDAEQILGGRKSWGFSEMEKW